MGYLMLRMRSSWNLIAVAVLALAVAACADDGPAAEAGAATTATAALAPRPTATTDELVDVDGARLHLRCEGSGRSTVLLLPGFGGDVESWSTVAPAVAEETRVCTYSRYGTGSSDAPPADQTFRTQAADLRSLLDAAGEPGPYVVAGHSFGGVEAVAFADASDDVEGLLLLDTSPVDWPAAACSVEGHDGFRQTCAMFDPTGNPERLDVRSAFAEAAEVASLGDVPLTALTRSQPRWDGVDDAQTARLQRVWADGQARWASLSTQGEVVGIDATSHGIQYEQPDVVAGLVLRLLPGGS